MNEHSLKYNAVSALKKLKKAGVSQGQAEAHVEVISDALENVATKSDLKQKENSLVARMDLLSQQIEFLRDEFNQKMEKNFYKLLVLFPIACVSLLAVYDYLKDKFS